ncbi:DUF3397 family protein [Sporosarcina sp. Marseille-Q4063]|uniref:DUF3397 family protein n=1 Tax=Sporosarcina sp. Marseille-Q4063 TaxID=2810514 RepID=UPI001BAE74E8|nr:DUF3397 family protein [Sporosarcina sp. Marseille-Q4063]QUW21791.1 DUF3397 family protein [Sporosarcina sp. Marseille-Q4063]
MTATILSVLFGVLIFCPYIITILILMIYRRLGTAPASVLGQAADLTTPFLFLSVYIISRTIYGDLVGVYIAITSIIIIIIYSIVEKMNVKEFLIKRFFRKVWRLFFLLLSSSYVILLLIGLVLKIMEYTL